MSEVIRNAGGFVVSPDSPKYAAGTNPNDEYRYGNKGKSQPAPGTTLADGKPKYARDGLSIDWFDSHPRPVEAAPVEVPVEVVPAVAAPAELPAKTQHVSAVTAAVDPSFKVEPTVTEELRAWAESEN